MRLTAFFWGALAILTLVPTQMAAKQVGSIKDRGFYPLSQIAPRYVNTSEPSVKPTRLIAQESRTQRIRFAPGTDGTVVEGSVVRGTRDIYLLRAFGNQRMTVKITSLEKNAVFDIQAPNGEFLSQESTRWSGTLPVTGDYSVIVGGTRGNASYQLGITIR